MTQLHKEYNFKNRLSLLITSRSPLLLLVLFIIAVLIRLPGLDFHSFWYDEVSTAYIVTQPDYVELLKSLYTFEGTPPIFYILLKLFLSLFHLPVNEITLRLLPLIFGAGTTILIFLIVDEIASRRSALLSFFLTAFSSFHIYLSLEARSYGLLTFFSLLSLLLVLTMTRRPSILKTIPLLLTVFITVQLHYYALFWIFSLTLSLCIVKWKNMIFQRKVIFMIITATCSLLLVIPMLYGQVSHEIGSIRQELVSKWFLGIIYSPIKVLMGSFLYKKHSLADITTLDIIGIIPVVTILLVTFVFFINQFNRRSLNNSLKIVLYSVVITFIIYIACGWKVPTVHPRYMVNFLILSFGLIIVSVEQYKRIQYAFVLVLFIVNCFGIVNFYNRTLPYFEPWKEIAQFTNKHLQNSHLQRNAIIADFPICNTVAYYTRQNTVAFFAIDSYSELVQLAKVDIFGNVIHTKLFTTKFYPEDTTASFKEIVKVNQTGIYISKDRSSLRRQNELTMIYGQFLNFSLLKVFPTNQGDVSIFEWNYIYNDTLTTNILNIQSDTLPHR